MDGRNIVEFLKSRVSLFTGFSDARLTELVKGSRVTTFEPNEAIVEFGEEGRFLGILLDGEAEASVTDDSGKRHRIGTLNPGDIFGEMSLMTGDKTMADVIGTTRCQTLLVPQQLFSTLLVTQPQAVAYLSKRIVERLKMFAYDESGRELAASAFRRSEDPYGFRLETDEAMKLLVVNCGSSSLKYNLFDTADESNNARGHVERIGAVGTRHTYRSSRAELVRDLPTGGHREAFAAMFDALTGPDTGVVGSPHEIVAVGHRVVHGGDKYADAVIITEEVMAEIDKAAQLAPLHNPVNIVGINEAKRLFPHAHHVAVFDTAFHQTLPPYAYLYGLPYEYYEKDRIRRYGFHGTSHAYVSLKAAEYLKRPYNELETIICHLGNGASVCAVDHGRSVDTSMGFTPSEGLIMGTRCGDVDPGLLVHLMRSESLTSEQLDRLINRESGLKGLSGISNDMREIERAADRGDHRALLAFKTFCYRVRKQIGAYAAAMGGVDIIVFTGGIGQGSAGVRSLACQGLDYMGVVVDEQKNRTVHDAEEPIDIAAADAHVRVLIVPTDEERMIARETLRCLDREQVTALIHRQESLPVPLEVSAHHVHLAQEHVEELFGDGFQLSIRQELSQPGQYACTETVNLIGPKGRVERVRVLGPPRKHTQVEIAMTEQFKLGIDPPIRGSGDIEESPGITIEGTQRPLRIDKGVICALRHIHMSPEDALRFGLRDKDRVTVRIEGARELIFGDVLVRVHPDFQLAMHIDTDEANAADIATGAIGHIERIQSRG
jgi:acetate kinase